jgi:hypothetical protein
MPNKNSFPQDEASFKIFKSNNHISVDTTSVRDPNLSWTAKGIHLYLTALSCEQDVNQKDHISNILSKAKLNDKLSIKAGLKELINNGYVFEVKQTCSGKITKHLIVTGRPTAKKEIETSIKNGMLNL